jgi:ABC-type polysaccharide/polyol phosphate transport system ATPase subunit
MSLPAIRTVGLSKLYRLGRANVPYQTLREVIMEQLRAPKRWLRGAGRRRTDTIWALRDVSLEIALGEAVGIIGRNGAGKSTLLKILSRITFPTEGYAELRGRVGSLLEVGTGFHNELTGRENIYLNGAILGMKRAEIARQFDAIVAFSEVASFLDTPVKHYSSGMYLRLAFAVAAHLDTEVLLVDEVLAVGDAAFQKRCLGKMGDVAAAGRTVLFVSHNMSAVSGLCQRAVWIDDGKVAADGGAGEVTQKYLESIAKGSFQFVSRTHEFAIESLTLRNGAGELTSRLNAGDDLLVEVAYQANRRIERPIVMLVVQSVHGLCFAANMLLDGCRPAALDGRGTIACRFRSIPLLPQGYTLRLGILRGGAGREWILPLQDVSSFTVAGGPEDYGFQGEDFHGVASRSTPMVIPYEWLLPDGSRGAFAPRRALELIDG